MARKPLKQRGLFLLQGRTMQCVCKWGALVRDTLLTTLRRLVNMRTFVCYSPIAYVFMNLLSQCLCHSITSATRCRTFWSVDVPQFLGSQQLRGHKARYTYGIDIGIWCICSLTYLFTNNRRTLNLYSIIILRIHVHLLKDSQRVGCHQLVTPAAVSVWIQSICCPTSIRWGM